jgi:hypothetical protein
MRALAVNSAPALLSIGSGPSGGASFLTNAIAPSRPCANSAGPIAPDAGIIDPRIPVLT